MTKVNHGSNAAMQTSQLPAPPTPTLLLCLPTTRQRKADCDAHRAGPWREMGVNLTGQIWENLLGERSDLSGASTHRLLGY